MSDPLEPEGELLELARALKAHAEWQLACGAEGLPRGEGVRDEDAGRPPEEDPRPHAPPVRSASPSQPLPSSPRAAPTGDAAAPPSKAPAAPPQPIRSVQGPPPDAARRLELLAEEVKTCTRCGLHAGRQQAVFARGTGSGRLCFVGEGPGADEDEQGFPFVGKAGQLLDRMIGAMGFDRDEVYVCNIVKCRPPNNRKPEADEMAACVGYVQQQIELIDPEVIVALGATAVEGLFGSTAGITRIRGRMKLYKGRIAVMPTFHPAYLLRNPAAKREVWEDLQAVVRHMGRELPAKGAPRG